MPITRRQFELGIDSAILEWMKRIHGSLAARMDQAYSEKELATGVGGWTEEQLRIAVGGEVGDFRLALEKLLEVGAVEARLVKGTVYYSYRGPLDV